MQRITISIDDDLLQEIDNIARLRNYQNRSEAIRDLARAGIQAEPEVAGEGGECVAALFYVYDHEARELSKRLTRAFHDNHDLSLASLHVHLDHGNCMEVSLLKGKTEDVREFSNQVIAERGVRHGKLVIVPSTVDKPEHEHEHEHELEDNSERFLPHLGMHHLD